MKNNTLFTLTKNNDRQGWIGSGIPVVASSKSLGNCSVTVDLLGTYTGHITWRELKKKISPSSIRHIEESVMIAKNMPKLLCVLCGGLIQHTESVERFGYPNGGYAHSRCVRRTT